MTEQVFAKELKKRVRAALNGKVSPLAKCYIDSRLARIRQVAADCGDYIWDNAMRDIKWSVLHITDKLI